MSDDLTPTDPNVPAVGPMPCPTCGATVPADARFCPNCGTPREAMAPPDTTQVMAPIPRSREVVEEEVVAAPAGPRDRPWPWALTIGVPILLLVILLVVLALRSLGGDSSPSTTTTTAVSSTTSTTTRSGVTRPATTRPPVTQAPTTSPATSPPTAPATTSPPATQPATTVSVP
jgi:hypothetical protein